MSFVSALPCKVVAMVYMLELLRHTSEKYKFIKHSKHPVLHSNKYHCFLYTAIFTTVLLYLLLNLQTFLYSQNCSFQLHQ